MSAFKFKTQPLLIKLNPYISNCRIELFIIMTFFNVSFIHSSLKYIKSRPAPFTSLQAWGYNWSPADWKFPLKGPDLAKVQEVVKNSFYKIMLPSVFQKCNPIASHQPRQSVAECRCCQCQSSRFIPKGAGRLTLHEQIQ